MTISSERGAAPGGGVEVRWSALRVTGGEGGRRTGLAGRSALVMIVRPVDDGHVLLEAWLETAAGSRRRLASGPARCTLERDGSFLHLDVRRNGRRELALTLEGPEARPRYAASPLLAEAGFAPGSYDPPTARLVALERDVASA